MKYISPTDVLSSVIDIFVIKKPVLADEFVFLCDDYDWPEVRKGTQDGTKEAGYKILFDHTLAGNDHDNEGWWNGYYVALLKK